MHPGSRYQTGRISSLGTDRRRSTRIRWRIPVIATWHGTDTLEALTVREHAETLDISEHGALLELNSNLTRGHSISILSPGGKALVSGRVVRNLGPGNDGRTRLGVEVDIPGLAPWVRMAY